jgi:hypothetical protein
VPYREPDPQALARSAQELAVRDELRELAVAGRARAQQRDAGAVVPAGGGAWLPAPRRSFDAFMYAAIALALAAVYFMFGLTGRGFPEEDLVFRAIAGGLSAIAGGAVALRVATSQRRRAIAQRWAARLPFATPRVGAALLRPAGELKVTVDFVDEPTDETLELLRGLCGLPDDDARLEAQGRRVTLRRIPASMATPDGWVRDLCEKALAPLHRLAPIAEVRVLGDTPLPWAAPRLEK